MRNINLIDAVASLHDIARIVEHDVGIGNLSQDIRSCADRLHAVSIAERKYAVQAVDVINKAKT